MPEIRPFRGVHYNKPLMKDWPAILCPPYDIIPPQLQEELYLRNNYNFVRLEFGRELPQDTATDNKYTRSATTLEQWLKQGILEVDQAPALYLHDQYFTYQGREYKRRSLIARVRVEEWEKMAIRPHEGTIAEPSSDRLSLLWALQANTSPVLALYDNQGGEISSILSVEERNEPLVSLEKIDGEGHDLWAITEPGAVERIADSLAKQPLYIADGHHRYESALAYQRERRALASSVSGEEAFNFVMVALVDFADPGLLILPPHRLVRGISKPVLSDLMPKLNEFFEIEELPVNMPGIWERVDSSLADTSGVRLGLFGLNTESLLMLKLRDQAAVSQMMPYFHSELYKKLDVSILDHIILEKLLMMDSREEKFNLAYSYDKLEAVNRVRVQEYQLAFLLSPVRVEVIKAMADAGDKMPRKSTYFYPKAPSGLVLNRLV